MRQVDGDRGGLSRKALANQGGTTSALLVPRKDGGRVVFYEVHDRWKAYTHLRSPATWENESHLQAGCIRSGAWAASTSCCCAMPGAWHRSSSTPLKR